MPGEVFQVYSASHWLMLLATGAAAVALLDWFRNPAIRPNDRRRMRRVLALILVITVCCDPLLAWLRYGSTPSVAWRIILESSLPLFLCDVVSLMLAWALWRGGQHLAEAGFFWGLIGTTQGLLTPALSFGWQTPEFYGFFLQHGMVPIAALLLAFGLGLGPRPGYFRRMLWWSWGYLAVVLALNYLLGTNYGFLNAKPAVPSLLDWLGPWPYYLLSLQAIAFVCYLALGTMAIRLARRFPPPATLLVVENPQQDA